MLTAVWILSKITKSLSTHSVSATYLISMCLVLVVGFCAFAMAVAASLSSYMTVAACCGMPKSHRILRMNSSIFAASHAAINSASVDESATVGCNLILYAIGPPAIFASTPDSDRRIFKHAAQSESTNVCDSNGPCLGCLAVVVCLRATPCLLKVMGVLGGRELVTVSKNKFHPFSCTTSISKDV